MRINLPLIAEAAQTRSNSNYSVIQLSDLNHMFQTSTELEQGDPAAWVANQETVSSRVLQLVGDWLEEVCQETE